MPVSVHDIASTVGALIGGVDWHSSRRGKEHDIRVRLDPEQRLIPEDVQRIWIGTVSVSRWTLKILSTYRPEWDPV